MTNVSGPGKVATRYALLHAGTMALEREGWRVERVPGLGKSSVRRITRGGESRLTSFKTSQDAWLAFARTPDNSRWVTLADVDSVLVMAVDDPHRPRFANIYLLDAEEVRRRFDRAYAARQKAGHALPDGRGIWLSLYDEERTEPVSLVGAGLGVDFKPIARLPLNDEPNAGTTQVSPEKEAETPLTIPEAKRRLALAFGVEPSAIRITVEG